MRLMIRGFFALLFLFLLATATEPLSAAIRQAIPVFKSTPSPIQPTHFARTAIRQGQ